jgi:ABC-type uncharacterized transport system permease subunit
VTPARRDLLVRVGLRALAVLLVVAAVALAWVAIVVFSGAELAAAASAVRHAGLLRPDSLAATASAAAPLLLAGLAAAIALRAGLVNLGVQGQALVGALAAALVAEWARAPGVVLLPLAALAGMGAGLAWALLPALLRVWRGVPELLTTVLASYLAVAAVTALPAAAEPPRLRQSAVVGSLAAAHASPGPGATWPALLTWTVPAALAAVLLWAFVLRRSYVGLWLRALALAPRAARVAGAPAGVIAVASLLLSGAVAGLAALQDVLGRGTPVSGGLGAAGVVGLASGVAPLGATAARAPVALSHLPDYGLLAIAVAFAGRASGLGMTAAAGAMALLDRAGLAIGPAAGLPRASVALLQVVLVLAAVAAARVSRGLAARWEKLSLQGPRSAAARPAAEVEPAAHAGHKVEEAAGGVHA